MGSGASAVVAGAVVAVVAVVAVAVVGVGVEVPPRRRRVKAAASPRINKSNDMMTLTVSTAMPSISIVAAQKFEPNLQNSKCEAHNERNMHVRGLMKPGSALETS